MPTCAESAKQMETCKHRSTNWDQIRSVGRSQRYWEWCVEGLVVELRKPKGGIWSDPGCGSLLQMHLLACCLPCARSDYCTSSCPYTPHITIIDSAPGHSNRAQNRRHSTPRYLTSSARCCTGIASEDYKPGSRPAAGSPARAGELHDMTRRIVSTLSIRVIPRLRSSGSVIYPDSYFIDRDFRSHLLTGKPLQRLTTSNPFRTSPAS